MVDECDLLVALLKQLLSVQQGDASQGPLLWGQLLVLSVVDP